MCVYTYTWMFICALNIIFYVLMCFYALFQRFGGANVLLPVVYSQTCSTHSGKDADTLAMFFFYMLMLLMMMMMSPTYKTCSWVQ